MKVFQFSILAVFVLVLWGTTSNYKSNERIGVSIKDIHGGANCTSIFDSCKSFLPNNHIEIFDTADCIYQIFKQNMNPKFVKAIATRYNQNPVEISLTTMELISKPDSTLRGEYYENRIIGLGFSKIYRAGYLRECGFEIFGGKVGKWKYFSLQGELDSIVDYEIKRSIHYCDFFEIARVFGMLGEKSRLPERKRLFEIADSLGLKSCNSIKKFSNPNWRSFEFYPIHDEEENNRFDCRVSYLLWHSNEWTIEKLFNIQGKMLCFNLSFYPETKEVFIYECLSVK